VKLVRVEIENFMGLVGVHSLPIESLGLAHIAGINNDDPANSSNGSGKSTLLEALTWGLFGEGLPRPQGNSEQGVRADEVLNDSLRKQCRVEVELHDGTQPIVVERVRKYKAPGERRQQTGARLTIGSATIDALDEKEVNRKICEAIGITREIWVRAVVFGQESAFNFCDATAKQRESILTTVMGLEEIGDWHKHCREEKRELAQEQARLDGRLGALKQRREEQARDDVGERLRAWEADRDHRLSVAIAARAEQEQIGKRLKAEQAQLQPLGEQPVVDHDPPVDDLPVQLASGSARNAYSRQEAIEAELSRLRQERQRVVALQGACPTCLQAIAPEHVDRCVASIDSDLERLSAEAAHAATSAESAKQNLEQAQQAYRYAVNLREDRQRRSQQALIEWNQLAESHRMAATMLDAARTLWVERDRAVSLIEGECNPFLCYSEELAGSIERVAAEIADVEIQAGEAARRLELVEWWDRELPRLRTWLAARAVWRGDLDPDLDDQGEHARRRQRRAVCGDLPLES
jgi:DNA repair exonuclease SbcCD ATPase subunit